MTSMTSVTLEPPLPLWLAAPAGSGLMGLAFAVAYPLSRATEPSSEAATWPDNDEPSSAINFPPSENVGAVLISCACVLLSWAFAARWAENRLRLGPLLLGGPPGWLNEASCWLGQLSLVVCPIGVAATPWHLYPSTHYAFAYTVFYGGATYLCIQSYLDHVAAQPGGTRGASPAVRTLRLGLIALGTVCMLLYWLCFGLVGRHTTSLVSNAVAQPAHAVLELSCMTILLSYVASLGWTQRRIAAQVVVSLPGRRRGGVDGQGGGGEEEEEPLLKHRTAHE